VSSTLGELAEERQAVSRAISALRLNVDTSPQISQRFGVQAIPTLLVLRYGQVAARQTGAAPLATLRAWVDNALAVG